MVLSRGVCVPLPAGVERLKLAVRLAIEGVP